MMVHGPSWVIDQELKKKSSTHILNGKLAPWWRTQSPGQGKLHYHNGLIDVPRK